MAVVLEVQGPGMTPEQYDELLRMVDWENQPARNGIFHVAWFDDEGLRIVDVWESEQAWHDFVNERLAPAFAQFG